MRRVGPAGGLAVRHAADRGVGSGDVVVGQTRLVDATQLLEHLRIDGARFVEAARASDLDAAVPTCPGWSVADLLVHTAEVFRGRTFILATGATTRPAGAAWRREVPAREELVGWFEEELAALVDQLTGADPRRRAWTWWPPEQTVGFWSRRMAHETAVHRVDAQAALGRAEPVSTPLAVDGIDEALDLFLAARLGAGSLDGPATTVHLHATDAEGEWLVHLGPDGLDVERGHAKGDAAARGTASDLLLWLWGRVPLDRLEVFGDTDALARLRAAAAGVT